MKRKITLKRIFHRDLSRIGIFFDYDEKLKEKVRSIAGATFSSTHKCFYVDDNEENLKSILRKLKDDADIDLSSISWKGNTSSIKEEVQKEAEVPEVSLTPVPGAGDIDFESPSLPKTTRRIITEDEDIAQSSEQAVMSGYGSVEFRANNRDGLLIIRFLGRYDPEWIKEMRSYGDLGYDRRSKEWKLPWSEITCDSLADYFTRQGVGVNVRKQAVNKDLKDERKATGDEIRSKDLSKKALDGLDLLKWFLDENRYSLRTRKSYLAMLGFFFRYFSSKEPDEISEEEISGFLYNFIIRLGYSAAYQNQMVSAIKTYYSVSGRGRVNPEFLARPRRSRALPKVFSKDEVSLILNSNGNLKHKLILWMIYSCGLRRTEVTNIKVCDLDRERSILHIREGKGKVDRIVPVPVKVWGKLDEYFSCYSPKVYLFEGQGGGRYSSESVYRVFKQALVKAGIKKEVGVHSLRHSYATHLHENGLDIRYIQELLGHRSTRTTEIYTHVSRRNLVAVRSPIEDLDVR